MADKKSHLSTHRRTRSQHASSPLATGWLRPDTMPGTDLAVGVFARNDLTNVLSLIHARGVGQAARVFDPARGDLTGQLQRAGVATDLGLMPLRPEDVVVVVRSAGRATLIGDLMLRANAKDVRIVTGEQDQPAPPHAAINGIEYDPAAADANGVSEASETAG